jgi:outer membrane protein OmpA-like peptidoglycan-associated protein
MCLFFIGLSADGQTAGTLDELEKLFDSTRMVEAYVFAPKSFEKAEKILQEARRAIELKKKQKKVDELIGESREYAENALKSTEVTKLSLSEYLDPRNKAVAAKADVLTPELYQKAEEQFLKATKKVEEGDVKGGLKEAEKSVGLFDTAELNAIKVDIMGDARTLIEKAEADEAQKYALTALDKARTAYTRCDEILSGDRYNRKESLEAAAMSEYEARHASNIAQSVRSMERNDQAFEKLMLLYEIEMQRVADELKIAALPFDRGPIAAADSLRTGVKTLRGRVEELEKDKSDLAGQLRLTISRLNVNTQEEDPLELVKLLDQGAIEALVAREKLAGELEVKKDRLAELELSHEEVATELQSRVIIEEKIKKARELLNPTEGEVLFNATNDIVLRLFGLSFASGSSDLREEHVPLLTKVEKVLKMFPESKLMVEGHTDDLGERSTNMRLSERRAIAVMQYIRKKVAIPADKISAIGYGPDKPIGTNTTYEGRAKNRRIDIIIFQ